MQKHSTPPRRVPRRVSLTARTIAALKPEANAVDWFDAETPGLAIRVTPAGARTWYLFYTVGRSVRRVKLGTWPALELSKARKRARSTRVRVDEGADPAQERQAARDVFTFADMATLYETFAKGRKKTWRDDVRKTTKYLLPAWGSMPLRDVTRTHVHQLLDTLVAKGLTTGVNRVQSVISRLFYVALDRGLIDAHPAARVMKRHTEQPRDRTLTDDELRALWTGLQSEPSGASDCLTLRLLLGQRMVEELMPMAWVEVHLDTALWIIPRERTKNQKQPHTVPLPSLALAILKRRRKALAADEPRVFPGLRAGGDDYRTLSALHQGAYTWTDLRRTMGTRMAGLGISETTIGRVLNHAKVTVTARHYNLHAYDEEKRAALKAWNRELQRIMAGQSATSPGERT